MTDNLRQVVYDKNRRPILEHDVLKVFHFIGARRKRYYMYKIAGKYVCGRLIIHHLPQFKGQYSFKADGQILEQIEIVEGYGKDDLSYENRERLKNDGI